MGETNGAVSVNVDRAADPAMRRAREYDRTHPSPAWAAALAQDQRQRGEEATSAPTLEDVPAPRFPAAPPEAEAAVSVAVPPIVVTALQTLGVSNVVTLLGLALGVIAVAGLWGPWAALLVLAVALVALGYVLYLWEQQQPKAPSSS